LYSNSGSEEIISTNSACRVRHFAVVSAWANRASTARNNIAFWARTIIYAANDEMYSEENFHHKKKAVQRALAELTPRQKEAIYLRYMNRMSYEEICQIMDMNYQSARNLIFRAVEKMRLALAQTNFTLLLVLKHC
jgi:RNA polymerase sigma factor (sigma-70 family)